MEILTLSGLLLASPFVKDLLELTIRLTPLILEAGRLIQNFRTGRFTPQATHEFEKKLQDLARRVCREIVEWTYNHLEPADLKRMPVQLCHENEWYRRRKKTRNRAPVTLFGPITLRRFRYEALEAGVRSIFPLEINLGFEADRVTPALAERVAELAVSHTQQQVLSILRQDHGVFWSVKSLRKVLASMSEGMSAFRHQAQVAKLVDCLKEVQKSGQRGVLSVGRDGIMVPIRGDKKYREGAAGTVSVLGAKGKRLATMYLGRMPEKNQKTLTQQLTDLIKDVLQQRPGALPLLEYVADGGDEESAYFRKELRRMEDPKHPGRRLPWVRVLDFYHACEYISKLAEALFGTTPEGKATAVGQSWARKMRRWLRDKRRGIYRVLYSAAALYARYELSAKAEREYEKAVNYLSKRKKFMDYVSYRRRGLAIGSGITEAACKTVFTQRLKQSGMKWCIEGGQVIVDLRVIWLSNVWQQVHGHYLASKPQLDLATIAASQSEELQIAA